MLLNENDQVLSSDLQVDNGLADEHEGCEDVVQVEKGHLRALVVPWVILVHVEGIWHGNEHVVRANYVLLLVQILLLCGVD